MGNEIGIASGMQYIMVHLVDYIMLSILIFIPSDISLSFTIGIEKSTRCGDCKFKALVLNIFLKESRALSNISLCRRIECWSYKIIYSTDAISA